MAAAKETLWELPLNADSTRCKKIRVSFGIVRVLHLFLLPLETIELQLACKFFYNIAIGRVQTWLVSSSPVFFTWAGNGTMTQDIVSVTRDQPSVISKWKQEYRTFGWQSI